MKSRGVSWRSSGFGKKLISPVISITAVSICDKSKYPAERAAVIKSSSSIFAFLRADFEIFELFIKIIGVPFINLRAFMLFRDKSSNKTSSAAYIIIAKTPFHNARSIFVAISAAIEPIEMPMT